jgi:hypothetical protein
MCVLNTPFSVLFPSPVFVVLLLLPIQNNNNNNTKNPVANRKNTSTMTGQQDNCTTTIKFQTENLIGHIIGRELVFEASGSVNTRNHTHTHNK